MPTSKVCILADSIATSHALNPSLWGVTRNKEFLRLNFGKMEALACGMGAVLIMCDMRTLERDGTIDEFADKVLTDYPDFESVPGSSYVRIAAKDSRDADSQFGRLRSAHHKHLQLAAKTPINGRTRQGHHPALVSLIGAIAGTA